MRGKRISRKGKMVLFLMLPMLIFITGVTLARELGGAVFAVALQEPAAAGEPSPENRQAGPSPDAPAVPTPGPGSSDAPQSTESPGPTLQPAVAPVPVPVPAPSKPSSGAKITAAHPGKKRVALTFDDGPDSKYTPAVLDILKKFDVRATFFLVGIQVTKFPKTALRITQEGHEIGNHSWSHPDLTKLSGKSLDDQVTKTQQAIAKAAGVTPELLRAPYGSISEGLIRYLHGRHMKHVYWTVDTRDWAGTSVAEMRRNVLKNTRPGGIILMHSFGGRKNALEHTLLLLPVIIEDLKKEGYAFATVDEMMKTQQTNTHVVK
jgi:peptidoglycan/xylan/chitin deacetylase (PgdA/CDA1 family)